MILTVFKDSRSLEQAQNLNGAHRLVLSSLKNIWLNLIELLTIISHTNLNLELLAAEPIRTQKHLKYRSSTLCCYSQLTACVKQLVNSTVSQE